MAGRWHRGWSGAGPGPPSCWPRTPHPAPSQEDSLGRTGGHVPAPPAALRGLREAVARRVRYHPARVTSDLKQENTEEGTNRPPAWSQLGGRGPSGDSAVPRADGATAGPPTRGASGTGSLGILSLVSAGRRAALPAASPRQTPGARPHPQAVTLKAMSLDVSKCPLAR